MLQSLKGITLGITGTEELTWTSSKIAPRSPVDPIVRGTSQRGPTPRTANDRNISRPRATSNHFETQSTRRTQRRTTTARTEAQQDRDRTASQASQSRRKTQPDESTLAWKHRHQCISDAKHRPKRTAFVAEKTFQQIISRRKTSTEASDTEGRTIVDDAFVSALVRASDRARQSQRPTNVSMGGRESSHERPASRGRRRRCWFQAGQRRRLPCMQ